MKYMGSKARLAKYLLPIILKDRKENQTYCEPFLGGGNMIDKVSGKRIGSDVNHYLIEALKLIRDCPEELPTDNKEFTEKHYNAIKHSKDPRLDGLKGFAGFSYSFGGKYFGGWSRDGVDKRDYVRESYDNAIKQSPKLKGVDLFCCSYENLEIPQNSIIYCDIPYKNSTKYSTSSFDHEKFWKWCETKNLEGHSVFVSEYSAPENFECIFEKSLNSSFDLKRKENGGKVGIEKLFVLKH